MSYEFRSGSQTFDLPNPYSVENRVRFALGGLTAALGVALLFLVRERLLDSNWNLSSAWALGAALLLLGYAVRSISIGLLQLRFFFGRDRPLGLARQHQAGSPEAANLIETVHRGALQFKEPIGSINGLLYHLQRNLIFAPARLQEIAQAQFRIAIVVAAIVVSFLLASLLLGRSEQRQWLGLLYLILSSVTLLPAKQGAAPGSSKLPVVLFVLAILGPVVLTLAGPSLPGIGALDFLWATLCMLLLSGAGATLFFFAVRAQLAGPPPATSAHHQIAASWNGQPVQLVDELARRLQAAWREQIPNRCYRESRPDINAEQTASGNFDCTVLQETQPFPARQTPPRTIKECLADNEKRWVLYLQLFGALLVSVAFILLAAGCAYYTAERLEKSPAGAVNLLLFFFICGWVGRYCLGGAHALFGRFDYESVLYLFECAGSWTRSQIDSGNVLTGQLKTQKSLVTVDNATLTVWVVELHSVAFGKDGARSVSAMIGRHDDAKALALGLLDFSQELSVVTAPTSQKDFRKVATMAALSSSTPGLNGAGSPQLLTDAVAATVSQPPRSK